MPTVPKYERNVAENPLPSVRQSGDLPAEAFGGGQSTQLLSRSAAGMGDMSQRIMLAEKQKADSLMVLSASQKLAEAETRILYDKDKGALHTRGEQVFGMPDRVMEEYKNVYEEVSKTLKNDTQRLGFKRAAGSRYNDVNKVIQNHFFTEKSNFHAKVTDSFLKSELDAAASNYHDPERINKAIDSTREKLAEFGAQNGVGKDVVEQNIQERVSKIHLAVIDRMLANGNDREAQAYYRMIKGNPPVSSPGLITPGNIDLSNRPQVQNPDGSVSTVKSTSVNLGGREVLLPTIAEDGRKLSVAEAVEQYKTTGKHLGIFESPQAATRYAKSLHNAQAMKIKGGLAGSDIAPVEKALEEGSIRGESQRRADAILSQRLSYTESLELVRQIKDPKIRDATDTRVKDGKQSEVMAKKLQDDDVYQLATNLVDSNPGRRPRDLVPPMSWNKLSLEHRNALESRATGTQSNDDKRWLDFLELKPGQLAGLSRADFEVGYWSKFDNAHRNRAETMWKDSQNGKENDLKVTMAFTAKERMFNSLRLAKVIPETAKAADFTVDQVRLVAEFEAAFSHALEAFEKTQLGGKRLATGDEQQKVLDTILKEKVFINQSWLPSFITHKSIVWGDEKKPLPLVHKDEEGFSYVNMEDIPPADQKAIERQILARKKKVSTSKLERAYGAFLLNKRKLFEDIIGE